MISYSKYTKKEKVQKEEKKNNQLLTCAQTVNQQRNIAVQTKRTRYLMNNNSNSNILLYFGIIPLEQIGFSVLPTSVDTIG